jgi:hypothetical protein
MYFDLNFLKGKLMFFNILFSVFIKLDFFFKELIDFKEFFLMD